MSDAPSHGKSPPDDEPATPAWLTALGVALFVAAGAAWVWMPSKSKPSSAAPEPAASAVAPSPPPGGGPHR
ncbi:MAG: hypothetical protein ACLP1X_20380 [Polyangiaceae bacterium]